MQLCITIDMGNQTFDVVEATIYRSQLNFYSFIFRGHDVGHLNDNAFC